MSRFGNTCDAEIEREIENCIPKNTKKSQSSIWNQFCIFCKERNFDVDKKQPIEDLAKILMDWGYNMKKKNGEDYKEYVVKTMWNSTAKMLQNLYFEKFKVILNPFTDSAFKKAREARNSKRKRLQNDLAKRKESSVALTKSEIDNMALAWDENTPIGLLKKFFHVVAYELAWRGGEAANCKVHYFKEEKFNNGELTGRIEYNTVFSKTCQGGSKKCCDSKWLIKNRENPDICPVRLFYKILSHRPNHISTDRFFLTPNPFWRNDTSKGWYKNVPLGINEILKWTKISAEKIGLDVKNKKITNHSHRCSTVSNLAKAGVTEQEVIKITGHSSSSSIKPYLQLNSDHHQNLVANLRGKSLDIESTMLPTSTTHLNSTLQTSVREVETTSVIESTAKRQIIYSNCIFNNCSF